jgi:hypothetical protein
MGKNRGRYTCSDYRQEMILLSLQRQLADPNLSAAEKGRIFIEVSQLQRQMGMDEPPD